MMEFFEILADMASQFIEAVYTGTWYGILTVFLPLIASAFHWVSKRVAGTQSFLWVWVAPALIALPAVPFVVFSLYHLVSCPMCMPFTLLTLLPTFAAVILWLVGRKTASPPKLDEAIEIIESV